MRNLLHLNPYRGRDASLASHLSGALLNPMQRAHASGVTLACAARYLRDPAGYDAERAWSDAVAELGDGAPEAFALFARAHRFSPLDVGDRDQELEALLDRLRDGFARGADVAGDVEALRTAVAARLEVADTLRSCLRDRRLAAEIEPWIDSHAVETRRIGHAADLLAALQGDGVAKDRMFAFFALEGRLSREPLPSAVSYGPRRLLYPQLDSMRDDAMRLADDPTLLRDRCLADAFVTFAEDQALARVR